MTYTPATAIDDPSVAPRLPGIGAADSPAAVGSGSSPVNARDTVLPVPRRLEAGASRWRSRATLFNLLHWSGWLVFAAIPFVWTVRSWGLFGALLNNLIFVVSGGFVTLGLRFVYRGVRKRGMSYVAIAPCVLLASAILAEFWYAIELLIARSSFQFLATWNLTGTLFAFGAAELASNSYLIKYGQWFVYFFALLTWSSLYFGITSIMELEVERKRAGEAIRLAESARLTVLQAQLNPHFIFNALNGVTTLIRERKTDAAVTMVSTLSGFLRATLRTGNRPELTVSEELVFVDQYIELQQLRFADRLRFHIDAAEETFAALLPTLILQPLVENAVVHGALSQGRGGAVRVSIHRSGVELVIAVEDNGAGGDLSTIPSFGVGLTNTAERLNALYGEAGRLSIGKSAAGGFVVTLAMPFHAASPRASSTGVSIQ